MSDNQDVEDFKKQFVENQKGIEELNQKLHRKTREVEIIQSISAEILNTLDLEQIFERIMKVMDEVFGFKHAMILMVEEGTETLSVKASRGYEQGGVGAKVEFGQGVIGVVAKRKKSCVWSELRLRCVMRDRLVNLWEGKKNRLNFPV